MSEGGVRYVVELSLESVGDFAAQQSLARTAGKTKGVDDAITKLRTNIGGFVSDGGSGIERIGRAFDWTAQKAMGVAKWAIAAGGAAAFAGMTYGVVGLNAELEKATVSLGTIFSAQGMAKDVPRGMEKAKGVIADMRRDAQKLPGEFNDLMQIYTAGAIPAFQAGLDENSWRQLASKVMAAGVVGQMPLDQVGREMTQLLQGRSGAHNVFGMKLMGLSGDKAQEFNKLDAGKRVELLSKELDKYAGAIDSFSATYEAASSTMIDNLKSFGLKATEPLFHKVTGSLNEVNEWFTENQARVGVWADRVGEGLAHAWDEGRKALEEWGPIILDFGERLYDRFGKVWEEISPTVQKFGEALKEALKDPGTIDKLMSLGKLYLEAKGVGAVAGFGLGSVHDIAQTAFYLKESYGIIKAIKATGGIGPALGLLVKGAPVLTTAAGGAGVAAGAGEAAVAGGAAAAGGEAALDVAAGTAGAGVAAFAGTLALAAADIGLIYYDIKSGREAFGMWQDSLTADAVARAEYAADDAAFRTKERDGDWDRLRLVSEEVRFREEDNAALKDATALQSGLNQSFDNFIDSVYGASGALAGLSGAARTRAEQAAIDRQAGANTGAAFEMNDKWMDKQLDAMDATRDVARAAAFNMAHGRLNNAQLSALQAKEEKARQAKVNFARGGGGGHTTVNISVASNQDPSRIARAVRSEFQKHTRMPTKSPKTTDFTAPKT